MSEQHPADPHKPQEDLPPGVELRPHVFDGIEEYDQRLPNWWLWSWYLAMIFFAIFWVGYYQFGLGTTDFARIEAHNRMVAENQASKLQEMFSSDPDGTLWKMSLNQASVESGKKIYESKCVACHGKDLSAMDGPIKLAGLPLNDEVWKYGADSAKADGSGPFKPMNIFGVVKDGSPDKASGMQSWAPVIGLQGVADVVSFVLSHHKAPADANSDGAAKPPVGTP